MNDVKTYVIVRDTIGAYGRHYRRFQEYVSETEAIFNTVMTIIKNDNTTMSVYEINGLMPEKKADVMDIGTLVYQKRGRKGEVVYDRRKEEAAAAGGDVRETEATTEESSEVESEKAKEEHIEYTAVRKKHYPGTPKVARTYFESVTKEEAVAWAKKVAKDETITASVYAVACYYIDIGRTGNGYYMHPTHMTTRQVGTLVFETVGQRVTFDADAAGGDAREAEAPEEPVMSEWRVSSSYYDGEKEYKVYRLRDVNATDHSGNRELYDTTIYKTRAEAKAVADALNAGKNPEEATVEENSTVDAKQEAQSTVDTEEEADELDAMPDVLPDPKIDAAIDQQKGNERAIKSHLLNNLQDKLHKLGYRDIFLYLNAKATTVKVFYERDEAQQTFDVTGLAPSAVGHEAWQRINDHLKRLRWAGKIA